VGLFTSVSSSSEESGLQEKDQSKERLITDLREWRKRVAESEKGKEEPRRAEHALQESQRIMKAPRDLSVAGFYKFSIIEPSQVLGKKL
jgi:hypothetical protein